MRIPAMATMVNPRVSPSSAVLARTEASLFAGINDLGSMRPCSASPSSFYSISRGVGLRAPSNVGAREPIARKIADLGHADNPKQIARRLTTRRTASKQQYNVPQQPETVPLWLWIFLASSRTAKNALQFLWEQPGQLKYIEWPSFQSTSLAPVSSSAVPSAIRAELLKEVAAVALTSAQDEIRMAVLTVVVVALLIVFLATIDSTFSYVLSSMLRRVP